MRIIENLSPEEVGYLAGGSRQAIFAAFTALRVGGAIGITHQALERSGPLPAGATALETALHSAVGWQRQVDADWPVEDGAVEAALDGLATGLAEIGLTGPDRPRGMAALFGRAGLGAPPHAAELAALRERNQHLAPRSTPAWATYGPAGAALAVALFGDAALRAGDPALAVALGSWRPGAKRRKAQRIRAWSPRRVASGSTGGSLWIAGGTGWGDADQSGSSDGGGSSCGGGGGCGGGS